MTLTIEQIFAKKIDSILSASPHGRQKEIADAVGISTTMFNNLVKGRRGSSEDLRREVCLAMGIRDYEQFIFGTGLEGAPKLDPTLVEFIDLYHQYGSPAFLQACRERLLALKELAER